MKASRMDKLTVAAAKVADKATAKTGYGYYYSKTILTHNKAVAAVVSAVAYKVEVFKSQESAATSAALEKLSTKAEYKESKKVEVVVAVAAPEVVVA